MNDIERLEELGYENVCSDYIVGSGNPIYYATFLGLKVVGCEDTLSFLALEQNREETNLWKNLIGRRLRK